MSKMSSLFREGIFCKTLVKMAKIRQGSRCFLRWAVIEYFCNIWKWEEKPFPVISVAIPEKIKEVKK